MKKIKIIFPDAESMAEFAIQHVVKHVEVDSTAVTLSGELTVLQLEVACEQFNAYQLRASDLLDEVSFKD